MTLAVVGVGLVSPGGITPRDHVFFLRAGVLAPSPSPFLMGEEDKRVDVRYCPWLGARSPVAERLARMAQAAAHAARFGSEEALDAKEIALFVNGSRPRPGVTEDDHRALVDALRKQLGTREVTSVWGAAGGFAALREARARLDAGARGVMIVAADSHVHIDAVAEDLEKPPSWWAIDRQALSEGAAALLLTDSGTAARAGLPVLGVVIEAQLALGTSNDDNDDIVDGSAMTTALRALPSGGKVHAIYGQYTLDNLRHQEWVFAEARTATRYHPEYVNATIEKELGRLGAAAGLSNLAYGIAVLHHDATEREFPPDASMLAWAISRDGTRGVALVRKAAA